jgi:hypothetical protein
MCAGSGQAAAVPRKRLPVTRKSPVPVAEQQIKPKIGYTLFPILFCPAGWKRIFAHLPGRNHLTFASSRRPWPSDRGMGSGEALTVCAGTAAGLFFSNFWALISTLA